MRWKLPFRPRVQVQQLGSPDWLEDLREQGANPERVPHCVAVIDRSAASSSKRETDGSFIPGGSVQPVNN
jgi:hypothetical protein